MSYYQLKSWNNLDVLSLLLAVLQKDFLVAEKASCSAVPRVMYIALQNGWRQHYNFASLLLQSTLKCFIWRSVIDVSWAGIRENRVRTAGLVPLVPEVRAVSGLANAKVGLSHHQRDFKINHFQYASKNKQTNKKRWTFNSLLPAWADGGINGHVSERAHHAVAVTVTVGIAGPWALWCIWPLFG